jgi:hypothetical protein
MHPFSPRLDTFRLVGLIFAFCLAGCTSSRISLDDLPVSEHRGHIVWGLDGATWFTPCGGNQADPWWITFSGQSVVQRERAVASGELQRGSRYFVRLSAAVTKGGEVGPKGPGHPALLVRNLLELRPARPDDCAIAAK